MEKNIQNTKSRWCRIGLLLVGCFALSQNVQAQVLINENFSTGSGQTPPVGWTNNDNGSTDPSMIWAFNNPGSRTITGGTPGFSGQFAILDSDFLGEDNTQNTTLATPPFDASAGGTYILDFDNQWRYSSPQTGTVDVWNGATWITVFSLPSSNNGYPSPANHKTIDITAATGGSSVAKVRFNINTTWGYWWAVDNVSVTKLTCTAPAATFAVVPDCGNSQFSVSVNLTSMGTATSVAIKEGATTYATATTTGTYTAGPFSSQSTHTLTLVNNLNAACNLVSGSQTYNCDLPNDDACGAVSLIVNTDENCTDIYSGDNSTATGSSQIDCDGNTIENDLWYSFVATAATQTVHLSNVGLINNDYVYMGLAAYSGSCSGLTQLDCNAYIAYNDFGQGDDPMTLTGLTVGQTYYVQTWTSDYDIDLAATFDLCISTPPPPPANDLICNAITLTVDGASDCQNTQSATSANDPSSMNNCSTPNNTVWYKFTPSTQGQKMITMTTPATGDPLDAWVFMYTIGSDCSAPSYTQIDFPDGCQQGSGGTNGSTASFLTASLDAGTEYYIVIDGVGGDYGSFCINVATPPNPPSSCATLLTPANTAVNVVANPYPVFTWNAVPGATGYRFYLGEDVANASEITSGPDTTVSISGLSYSTTYFWYVVPFNDGGDATGCDASAFSFTTEATPAPPANDDATDAISLVVGAPCSGAVYSNISATLNTSGTTSEPYPYCNTNSAGEHSVWFSFTAPSSGAVKITTDNGAAGSLNDTKIGLFAATSASDYSTFTILACDDDNGRDNDTTDYLSTIFATGLSQGTTYYIEVDGYADDDEGTFCLQVQEINPTMISNSASCADIASPLGNEATYDGWVTLLDETGNLVALVRNPAGGEAGDFSGSYNIDGNGFGMPRQDGNGTYYLSRNYTINNSGISTPVDVQLFFHMGEIATLTGVTQGATTLGNLNVTKQESTNCDANFLESNGATSVLLQNGNGSVNGVSWIQVSTSSFSNFYLMGGEFPLYVELKGITATNDGGKNRVDWSTAKENKGDYFELERSVDGRNFSFLATISGKAQPSAYTYWDNDPVLGVNYYRLKVINVDKKPFYSSVVTATVDHLTAFSMQAYPNPVNNSLILEMGGTREADASLIITDATGRTLRTIPVTEARVKVDMSSLAQGLYLIQYKDALNHKTIRVNKL